MYLKTTRLLVRDFTPEDAADLHEIFGDAETMKLCEPPYDFEKTKKFLEEFCIGRKGAVAAVLKDTGKAVGYILFKSMGEDPAEPYRRQRGRLGGPLPVRTAAGGFGKLIGNFVSFFPPNSTKTTCIFRKKGYDRKDHIFRKRRISL